MAWRSLVLTVICCVMAGSRAGAQQIRDSAGIRITENARPTLAPNRMWRILPQPLLAIGRTDGDSLYEFLRVMGVARLSDGRIAVGNQGSGTVRFFDSRGTYLNATGRMGGGPGEFRQILGLLTTRGDTLAVTDLNQVNYYTGAGKFIRSLSGGATARAFVYPTGFFADGSYIGFGRMANAPMAPRGGRWVDSVTLYRVAPGGTTPDSIGRFPVVPRSYSQTVRAAESVVFGPRLRLAAYADRLYIGYSAQFDIGVYSPRGRLESIIRRAAAPRPIPQGVIAEYRQRLANRPGEDGRPPPPEFRDRFIRLAAEAPIAEVYPAYSQFLVDRTGHLWVRQYEPWEDAPDRSGPVSVPTYAHPSDWDVFTPAGVWLGRIQMPAAFAPLDIGADYVAGLWRNADDVEIVHMYRLVKP